MSRSRCVELERWHEVRALCVLSHRRIRGRGGYGSARGGGGTLVVELRVNRALTSCLTSHSPPRLHLTHTQSPRPFIRACYFPMVEILSVNHQSSTHRLRDTQTTHPSTVPSNSAFPFPSSCSSHGHLPSKPPCAGSRR